MNILITGGLGLIGTAVASRLKTAGHRLTVLDRNSLGADTHLESEPAGMMRIAVGDTRDSELMGTVMADQDCVVHLAAAPAFQLYERAPIEEFDGAVRGFLTVLEAMRWANVRSLVYASTSAIYEGNEPPHFESMTVSPPDVKAIAKNVDEMLARIYSDRFGIRSVGLRPFSVYGAGERHKGELASIVWLFADHMVRGVSPIVWGDGLQTRDFVHVDDVADAIVRAIESAVDTTVLNIGTGVETSFNEIIALINRVAGQRLRPEYVPVPVDLYARRFRADTTLAFEKLGFRAQRSIEFGVSQLVASFKAASHN